MLRKRSVGILFSRFSLFGVQVFLFSFLLLIILCFTNIGFILQEESKIKQMILLEECSS